MEPGNENQEIMDALKEFEEKSIVEQQKQAANVPKDTTFSDSPKMVEELLKSSGGVIKSKKQAEYVLLGVVVAMLALSVYFFTK